MTTAEISIVIALVLNPVVAIIISLWYQRRKEKRQQKFNSFFALVSHRDTTFLSPTFVSQLNTIDIVFHDCPKILAAWKKYYERLNSLNHPQDVTSLHHLKLDLLHDIATHLGYKEWRQTDIDKYYLPNAIADQQNLNMEVQKELLSYLKNGNAVYEALLMQYQQSEENNSKTIEDKS